MSRTVVSVRLSPDELHFIDRLAAEKNITRSAVLHQIFLQQVALAEIEKSIAAIVDSRLATLSQKIDQAASRDDLIKATNFLVKELKK